MDAEEAYRRQQHIQEDRQGREVLLELFNLHALPAFVLIPLIIARAAAPFKICR